MPHGKDKMKNNFNLVATAAAGLESLTARELRDLGIETKMDDRSRVLFSGTKETIATANLWLRTADRVKIIIGEFPAKTFDELFEGVYALDWAEILPFGAQFPIAKAKAIKSELHNEPSIQAITRKPLQKKCRYIITVLKMCRYQRRAHCSQLKSRFIKISQQSCWIQQAIHTL